MCRSSEGGDFPVVANAAIARNRPESDAVGTSVERPRVGDVSSLARSTTGHPPTVLVDAKRIREVAAELDKWRARNRFYHERITEYLRFAVPEGESVLLIGCEDGELLSALRPSRGVGMDACPVKVACARERNPQHTYVASRDYACEPGGTFEYVVLNDMMGEVEDLFTFLQRLGKLCTPTSRVILVQHNYLWRPILRLASRLHLKRPEPRQNWLSAGDLRTFLDGAGFETIDLRSKLFCPKRLFGLGPVINFLSGLLPFVRRLASTEMLVARPVFRSADPSRKTATIVLTTRDERDNVEPTVRAIPKIGADTEIIFVDGYSRDGTREEIERVARAYPRKNIRLLVQTEGRVGDAILQGFRHATGDVIILVEADRTSPPEDALKAFDIIASGRAEYVNGSRFIYPREKDSMPRLNTVGNWSFAVWFTWFLGQRSSDVLCGLKAIDRVQFQRLQRRWGFLGLADPFGDFELIFGAARLGLKICEVPTRYAKRAYGRTKSRFFRHGWMLARMAIRATWVFKCR